MRRPMINSVLPYIEGCKILLSEEIFAHPDELRYHRFNVVNTYGKGMPALTNIANGINKKFGSDIKFIRDYEKDCIYLLVEKEPECEAAYNNK